jgi:hypothetical protein
MLLKPHSALLAAVLTVAAVLPASAQGFNPQQVKRNQASSLPDIGRPYSIRVTVGASTNAGFEKALTETDPNLKHWCWVPVTTANQAYIRVAPGQVDHGRPNVVRPKSVYAASKPVAVPLPRVRNWDLQYPKQIASRSVSRSSTDTRATLSYSRNQETKTYSDLSGRLYAPRTAYNESKDVFGKIVH